VVACCNVYGKFSHIQIIFADWTSKTDLKICGVVGGVRVKEKEGGCPNCHAGVAYHLGDGRRKCRRCGRRYTPHDRFGRLSRPILRQLALCFWQMVPARQAAGIIGLNRKTVQRHYRLLRVRIGGKRGEGQENVFDVDENRPERPLVALVANGSTIQVIPFAADCTYAPPCALVYPRTSRFAAGAELSDLQLWISGAGEEGARADAFVKFWAFAGRLAKMHRGRCLQELQLFLQEVAFRFNQRDNPRVTETLCRLLESD
jgi:transposase-like protein